VKHYHHEVGTDVVDALWNDPGADLLISRLAILEILSAFAGKVRASTISTADFNTLRRRFFADITKQKRPLTVRLLVRHFRQAEGLLRHQALTMRLRTLDALQLAVALDLRTHGLVSHFVCADRDLLAVAASEGFAILDPEHP